MVCDRASEEKGWGVKRANRREEKRIFKKTILRKRVNDRRGNEVNYSTRIKGATRKVNQIQLRTS